MDPVEQSTEQEILQVLCICVNITGDSSGTTSWIVIQAPPAPVQGAASMNPGLYLLTVYGVPETLPRLSIFIEQLAQGNVLGVDPSEEVTRAQEVRNHHNQL